MPYSIYIYRLHKQGFGPLPTKENLNLITEPNHPPASAVSRRRRRVWLHQVSIMGAAPGISSSKVMRKKRNPFNTQWSWLILPTKLDSLEGDFVGQIDPNRPFCWSSGHEIFEDWLRRVGVDEKSGIFFAFGGNQQGTKSQGTFPNTIRGLGSSAWSISIIGGFFPPIWKIRSSNWIMKPKNFGMNTKNGSVQKGGNSCSFLETRLFSGPVWLLLGEPLKASKHGREPSISGLPPTRRLHQKF